MESRSSCDLRSNIRAHATVGGWLFTLSALSMLLYVLQFKQDGQKLLFLENKQPQIGKELEQEQIDEGISFIMQFALVMSLIHSLFSGMYWIGYLKRVKWCLTLTIVYLTISLALVFLGVIGAFVQADFISGYQMLFALIFYGYMLSVTQKIRSAVSASPIGFVILVTETITAEKSPDKTQTNQKTAKKSPDENLNKETNATQIV